jgi:hypothetical protein
LSIIILSDDYEAIVKHLGNYLKAGDTKTPNRGRGQRVSKRNLKYESGNDDEEDPSPIKKVIMSYGDNDRVKLYRALFNLPILQAC